MSNDTDTSTSLGSSTEDNRKKKLPNKTHKRKSEKKHKKQKKDKKEMRRKHKKRSRRDDSANVSEATNILPISPPRGIEENATEATDAFGPALPPHLLQTKREGETKQKSIIGPTIPSEFKKHLELKPDEIEQDVVGPAATSDEEDSNAGTYGPMPVPSGSNAENQMSATQIELEQRALQLKLAAIDGTGTKVDQTVREEWMLELPDVGLKSGLAALSNMKRTFHQGKERPDFRDRSIWTKRPQDAESSQVASTSKTTAETLKDEAQAMYVRKRDEEQERIAKKHKKKHKRDESLVDIHQKKLRKEQKKREKELAASGEKPERRPFSRDVDLKLNKIDKNQTKQIVDKAKILNTKFSSGHTKYL